jgi:hypothetical protein
VSLCWAICGSHTIQRGLDCAVSLAEEHFDLDRSLSQTLEEFIKFSQNGYTAKEAKMMKLKTSDPRSIAEFFQTQSLEEEDKIKYYKILNKTYGMSSEEIKSKAAKSSLQYPSIFVRCIKIIINFHIYFRGTTKLDGIKLFTT